MKPWLARLYPERGSVLFARVHVWPTKKAMLTHLNGTRVSNGKNGKFERGCEGACGREHVTVYPDARAAKRGKGGRRHPCFAEVNLWRGKLTMAVVTHELFHATVAWGVRRRFPFAALADESGVTDTEERITYVHSELCRQFMVRATDAGLYG